MSIYLSLGSFASDFANNDPSPVIHCLFVANLTRTQFPFAKTGGEKDLGQWLRSFSLKMTVWIIQAMKGNFSGIQPGHSCLAAIQHWDESKNDQFAPQLSSEFPRHCVTRHKVGLDKNTVVRMCSRVRAILGKNGLLIKTHNRAPWFPNFFENFLRHWKMQFDGLCLCILLHFGGQRISPKFIDWMSWKFKFLSINFSSSIVYR